MIQTDKKWLGITAGLLLLPVVQVSVNDTSVTQPNLQASNGVVHMVDRVILHLTLHFNHE